ncbi:uncharacterized protein METZ01_LOCUS389908, partial [marine metagenome]
MHEFAQLHNLSGVSAHQMLVERLRQGRHIVTSRIGGFSPTDGCITVDMDLHQNVSRDVSVESRCFDLDHFDLLNLHVLISFVGFLVANRRQFTCRLASSPPHRESQPSPGNNGRRWPLGDPLISGEGLGQRHRRRGCVPCSRLL